MLVCFILQVLIKSIRDRICQIFLKEHMTDIALRLGTGKNVYIAYIRMEWDAPEAPKKWDAENKPLKVWYSLRFRIR